MTRTIRYKHINSIPALTWNWLKLNRASLEAEAADLGGSISAGCSGQAAYKEDGRALFAALPAMKSGAGEEADALLDAFPVTPSAVTAEKGGKATVLLRFTLEEGKSQLSRQAVVAEEGAELTVILDYTSAPAASAFQAVQTKLWAKAGSRIHLVKVNLLGASCIQLDDTAAYAEDGACIDITQIELGGAKVYAGVGATLAGYRSSFKSDTAYHTRASQLLDMNYAVWHKGAKTDTKMQVKGVVDGNAVKVYRGTIDFQRGCAGATGDEQEETLLLSPAATNKSIPMILCDEEDVSGTHGATIGRMSADELFYMQSRGIGEEEARRMMTRAKIASVAHLIPAQGVIDEIETYLDRAQA